jgi:dihydropteroate synthase
MQPCFINRLRIGGGAPVRLMGVINCSPESFYRGSYTPAEKTLQRAIAMHEQGADLIDLGARSTAPGSPPLSVREEAHRIDAALSELDGAGLTISVDTMHAEVLEVCLRHEIHAVNDIAGLGDPGYAQLVADSGLPAFVMASLQRPGDAVGLAATLHALDTVVERCARFGIDDYVLDPAVGKWVQERSVDDDWEICRNFEVFQTFGRPLLAAVSRKSFLGELLEKPSDERLAGTLAVTTMLLEQGAVVVRSHDVGETADLIKVHGRMMRA